jgi:hypothetical protein
LRPSEADFDHHVVHDYNDNRIEVPSYRIKYLGFRQGDDILSWYTPDDMKEDFNRENPKTGRELSSNRGRYYYQFIKPFRVSIMFMIFNLNSLEDVSIAVFNMPDFSLANYHAKTDQGSILMDILNVNNSQKVILSNI